MNEPDLNDADSSQVDFESYLKQFRPVETSASIAETFYQAGWRAAVTPSKSSEKRFVRGRWSMFLSGAACGMLPMVILFAGREAGSEPGVAKSDETLVPLVARNDEIPNYDDATSSGVGVSERSGHSSEPVASMPSAMHVFAESLMLQSWFPRLQIGEPLISSNSSSVLRFRPLTNEVMDLANIDQGGFASSKFLTTANDTVRSVDPHEPLSARSSALSEELLRELLL
jgi:hypothetical protein